MARVALVGAKGFRGIETHGHADVERVIDDRPVAGEGGAGIEKFQTGDGAELIGGCNDGLAVGGVSRAFKPDEDDVIDGTAGCGLRAAGGAMVEQEARTRLAARVRIDFMGKWCARGDR